MDRYVADAEWGHWIVLYFFLGGIAAGSSALSALATLFGDESDRRATRSAEYLGLPLIMLCGIFLIVDLGRPERFWHMLIQSQTLRPMLKWWSPMSAGSWGLSVFGGFSALSFLGVLVEDGWLKLGVWTERIVRFRQGTGQKLLAVGSLISAMFLGSYTGILLSTTNQPAWANTTWLGALFLASAMSTGLAAVVLLARWRFRDVSERSIERLERADGWAILFELAMLITFAFSLRGAPGMAFVRYPGMLIPLFVVPVGLVLPLVIRQTTGTRGAVKAALLVLVGGFVLRMAVVGIPPSLILTHRPGGSI
jgi:formate-dependent nitrite reductase membrane component NrfD